LFLLFRCDQRPPFLQSGPDKLQKPAHLLGPELQKKLIPIFYYALKPEGILFLGTSETIGTFSDLFSAVSNKWKVFKPKKTSLISATAMDYYPDRMPNLACENAVPSKGINREISLGDDDGKAACRALYSAVRDH